MTTTRYPTQMDVSFAKVPAVKGSNAVRFNVSVMGRPFGQIWTFKNTCTEQHPWHAKPLHGAHVAFYPTDASGKAGAFYAAQQHMIAAAVG